MSKFGLVNLIDKVFISVCIFLTIFAWVNFYVRDLWFTFWISIVFSFACTYFLFYILNAKHTKRQLNRKKIEEINERFLAFKLMHKNDKVKLMNSILSIDHETVVKNEKILLTKNNQTHCFIICTHFAKIDQETLLNILDSNDFSTDYLHIICNCFDNNLNTKIFKNKEIILIDKNSLYVDFFEKFNTFPSTENINIKITKLKFKDVLKQFVLPHKTKPYFICGLILIFSSLILPYHIYYVVMGSLLMTLALLCKILPKFNC